MTEMESTCAAVVGCKRPATMGYTCAGHYARLGSILADLEMEAVLVSTVPSMQQRTGPAGGLASHRSPARLDAIVHRDPRHGTGMSEDEEDELAAGQTMSILGTLHSWARVLREERELAEPEQVTVVGERAILARHLNWIVGQPWADEFYSDLNQLLGQLRAVNGTQPDKPVGRCYLIVEGETCDGPIWVDEANGHAHCARCRGTWDGVQLAHLKWELEKAAEERRRPRTEDGRRMLTAEEIAKQRGVKPKTIPVWAHRRGVVAVHGHYDPEWFAPAREIA